MQTQYMRWRAYSTYVFYLCIYLAYVYKLAGEIKQNILLKSIDKVSRFKRKAE